MSKGHIHGNRIFATLVYTRRIAILRAHTNFGQNVSTLVRFVLAFGHF